MRWVSDSASVGRSVVSDSATPRTAAREAPLSVGFSRQEYWRRLPFPFPGDLRNPGIEPCSQELQADTIPSELPRKPSFWRAQSMSYLCSDLVSNPVLVTHQCSEYLWKLASLSQNTEIFHFISAPWHPPSKSIFIRHTFFSGFHHEVFNSWVSTGKPCGSKQSGNHDIICWILLCMLSPALGKSVSRISRWCQGVPHLPFSFCRTECMHRQLLKPND